MNIQEKIIALLEGDLREDQHIVELIAQLSKSHEDRSMLVEHIALSNALTRAVIQVNPDVKSSAKLWSRIDRYESGSIGSGTWSAKQALSGVLTALIMGLCFGYYWGNTFNGEDSISQSPSPNISKLNAQAVPFVGVDTTTNSRAAFSKSHASSFQPSTTSPKLRGSHKQHNAESVVVTPLDVVGKTSTDEGFRILSPNGGETYRIDENIPIQWSGSNQPVTIEFSRDQGQTWSAIASNITGGSYLWSVPKSIKALLPSSYLMRASVEDTGTVEPTLYKVFKGHDSGAAVAEISPDGKYLLTVGADTRVILWDISTGKQIRRFGENTSEGGHIGYVTFARFNEDGTRIVTCSQDGTAKVWNVFTGNLQQTFYGVADAYPVIWSAAFSPDGTTIALGEDDGSIRFCRLSDGKEIKTITISQTEAVRYLDYVQNGTRIISSGSDGKGTLTDIIADTIVQQFNHFPFPAQFSLRRKVVNGIQYVPGLTELGDGIITCGYDGIVRFWDVATGSLITEKVFHSGEAVSAVIVGKGGHLLASVGYDGSTKIFDLDSEEVVATIQPDDVEIPMSRASFSSDMRFIAISHADGKATLWKLRKTIATDTSDDVWSIE